MIFQSKIDAALAYAAAGLAVFPVHSVEHGQCSCGNPQCRNTGKHPRTPRGFKDATIDTKQVKSWWESFPFANIGIRTGKESGIFVVDIDGEEGFQWLHQQPFAITPMVRTGGDGLHVFFAYPADREIKNSARKIAPEVDIRGDGGYVIAPPSNHASGNSYEWIQSLGEIPFAEAPQELLDQITATKEKKFKNGPNAPRASIRGQYLGAQQGSRDDALFRYACSLETQHPGPEDFREKVFQANQKNTPPLEDFEVERIIASAQKYFLRNTVVQKLESLPVAQLCEEIFKPETLEVVKRMYEHDPASWAKLKVALRKARILREVTAALSRMVNDEAAQQLANQSVRDALGDLNMRCPLGVDGDLILPAGYAFDHAGLLRMTQDAAIEVSPLLIVPCKRIKNHSSQEEMVDLAFFESGKWRSLHVKRSDALDTKKIVQLSDYGFPVSSVNAKEIVKYHHEFLAVNQETLPVEAVSEQFGWLNDSAFLLQEIVSHQPEQIRFRSNDAGESQIYDSLSAEGTFEEWSQILHMIKDYPRALVALYASFTAPLLKILKADNLLVDFCGLTSTGKTTCQRIAASVWGNPDERSATSFIRNWDTTKVGLERTLATLNDLPCIIDDTKTADSRSLERFIYLLVNGHGRMRGSKSGLARNTNWRTVCISSGEAPLTAYSLSSGSFARIVPIKNSPFGTTDNRTRELVDTLNRGVKCHYGHAGRIFVQWIIDNMDRSAEWQLRYDDLRYRFTEVSGAAGRIGDSCAVISLAGELVHEALSLPWTYQDPIPTLWNTIAAEFAEIDVGIRALRDIYDWAARNQSHFYRKDRENEPIGGWFGHWECENPSWNSLNIAPTILKDQLDKMGYTCKEILHNWQEKAWLVLDGQGDNPRFRLGQQRLRMVSLKRAAIAEVTGDDFPVLACQFTLLHVDDGTEMD
jgi:putative DNA primase/helicase